jgi:pyruvyl transferase EpsO
VFFSDKVTQLANNIKKALTPLITRDYWLLELPYYTNIGDILIWQGTEYFLKNLNVCCKYKSSFHTFKPRSIDAETIILLQGGGNFGDLWNGPHAFRRKIITSYMNNTIIILPQTVFYANEDTIETDKALFGKHPSLFICVRDKNSYQLLKQHFTKNTVLLVPDMAFCIPALQLKQYQCKSSGKDLFLKRTDKELNTTFAYSNCFDEKNIDVSDWPTMEKRTITIRLLHYFLALNRRIPFAFSGLTDIYASCFFKRDMVKAGVKFISGYNKVYTTRLHAAILCCLLGKPFVFFDNSYGKNSGFFETWFSDLDGVEFIHHGMELP